MTSQLVWERDGGDWPNREASRFVTTRRLRWHVQVAGQGPVLLLVHGTGAANHSWRDLLPPLAEHFTVVTRQVRQSWSGCASMAGSPRRRWSA
jgi:magnesium chelatase accessory protein